MQSRVAVAPTSHRTRKGKYELKAAVHLARGPGRSAVVADTNMIPKKFLDAIPGEPHDVGILHGKKQKGGR
jgi:hypothetical protein